MFCASLPAKIPPIQLKTRLCLAYCASQNTTAKSSAHDLICQLFWLANLLVRSLAKSWVYFRNIFGTGRNNLKKHKQIKYTTYNNLPRRAAMTRHRLSRRTATTTRFSPKGYRLSETDGAKVLPTSDQVGLYLASIHQMVPSDKQACYSIIDPGRMKGWVGLGSPVADGLPT